MSKIKLFLSGPYGFSRITTRGIQAIIEKLSKEFIILNPFEDPSNSQKGLQIQKLTEQIQKPLFDLPQKITTDTPDGENINHIQLIEKIQQLNMEIAERNEHLLREASIVFAILDGPDVDSGTAAEIGAAYTLGIPVFGYRSDFRMAGDNPGAIVNLQVEYFIKRSGGLILRNMDQLDKYISTMKRLAEEYRSRKK